jgi:ribosome production factor 1
VAHVLTLYYRHHRYIFEEKELRKAGEKTKKQRVIARLQVAACMLRHRDVCHLLVVSLRQQSTTCADMWPVLLMWLCIAPAQELGPRFVLRLVSLQKGTFDSRGGEFEWEPKKEKTGSRRKFNL